LPLEVEDEDEVWLDYSFKKLQSDLVTIEDSIKAKKLQLTMVLKNIPNSRRFVTIENSIH
jgi:hypothetical protein